MIRLGRGRDEYFRRLVDFWSAATSLMSRGRYCVTILQLSDKRAYTHKADNVLCFIIARKRSER